MEATCVLVSPRTSVNVRELILVDVQSSMDVDAVILGVKTGEDPAETGVVAIVHSILCLLVK
jgi:hypothetical protein